MAVFPFPQLAELREKYTYNITPFPTSVRSNGRFVRSQQLSLMSPGRGFSGANAEELWGLLSSQRGREQLGERRRCRHG